MRIRHTNGGQFFIFASATRHYHGSNCRLYSPHVTFLYGEIRRRRPRENVVVTDLEREPGVYGDWMVGKGELHTSPSRYHPTWQLKRLTQCPSLLNLSISTRENDLKGSA